jgi:hypothetical protein
MAAVVYHKVPATARPVVARVFRAQPCTIGHYMSQEFLIGLVTEEDPNAFTPRNLTMSARVGDLAAHGDV